MQICCPSGFERYRLAGQDLEIDSPRPVSLYVELLVCVKPNYFRSDVRSALNDVFSNRNLPDGRVGYFIPTILALASRSISVSSMRLHRRYRVSAQSRLQDSSGSACPRILPCVLDDSL